VVSANGNRSTFEISAEKKDGGTYGLP
jgi:hypothetical protein